MVRHIPQLRCTGGDRERAPVHFGGRDEADGERLEILNDREGVWRCRTIFNCTEACPREIRITKAVGEVKKAILKGSARAEPIRHPATSGA
jgi:succinate dehydrogenase/fumarate reductase-like Fe-S protein